MGGGAASNQFEMYVNSRDNSWVEDGVLYIQPTLTSDSIGEETVRNGTYSMWGSEPADLCTSNSAYGCEKTADPINGNCINPIQSARLRSRHSVSFKYGIVEVVAKLPKGDWIHPAIWMMPTDNAYGGWPLSGEIDIMESKGNNLTCSGSNMFQSTLHWGAEKGGDQWRLTNAKYKQDESFGDEFHTYGLYWDENRMFTYLDSIENIVLEVNTTNQSFFDWGNFTDLTEKTNPWRGRGNNAPFDQEFYIILNLSVGSTGGYWADNHCDKPWTNDSPHAATEFFDGIDQWWPTWNYPETNDSALKIDSVRVYSLDNPI